MNDKNLGYIILLILGLVILITAGYIIDIVLFPDTKRIFVLDQIGSLQIDDPLKIQGITAGKISSISRDNKNVYLTVDIKDHLDIYANYTVKTAEKGVLGERYLILEPGDSSAPLLEAGDTLYSVFTPGISEIMGHAWKLENVMKIIVSKANEILNGTEENPSFVDQFNTIFILSDSLIREMYTATRILNRELRGQIDTLDVTVAQTEGMIRTLAAAGPELVANFEEQVEAITEFVEKLKKMVNMLSEIESRMEDKENILWSDKLKLLKNKLDEMGSLIEELNKKASRLRLRISFMK